MKKILFAGTALTVAMIFSGPAAAGALELGVGGFTEQWVGHADNDRLDGEADVDLQSDTEIHFTGSSDLDNGLTVRARIEIEQATGGDARFDEASVGVESGFGAIYFGQDDNASEKLAHAAPEVGIGNQDGDFANWVLQPDEVYSFGATYSTVDGDAEKITYFTPSFRGFQAGVSYTPNIDETTVAGTTIASEGNDAVTVALSYDGNLNGIDLGADVAYFRPEDLSAGLASENNKLEIYRAGATLGYRNFTIGASIAEIEEDELAGATTSMDGRVWDIGVAYETGPIAFSLNYFETKHKADLANSRKDEVRSVMASASYSIAPGIAAKATVQHAEFEDEGGDATSNDGWAVVSGLAINF